MRDHTTRPPAAKGRRHRQTPRRMAALFGGSLLITMTMAGCSPMLAQSAPPAAARLAEAAMEIDAADIRSDESLERSREVREAAERDNGRRVVVSLEERRLWYLSGADTLYTAPVAIGKSSILEYGEKTYTFDTPVSIRTVRGREANPVWVPPDWHYLEVAAEHEMEVKWLKPNGSHILDDGRRLVVRGSRIGLVDLDGKYEALPIGQEIIFDNTVFVPPVSSAHRRIPGELGKYKIDLGDGILFHGTPHEASVGTAATHGCMRMLDQDIEWLYKNLPIRTPVYIY